METVNVNQERQSHCMRCGVAFPGGGPGVVFCASCAAAINRENGNEQTDRVPD